MSIKDEYAARQKERAEAAEAKLAKALSLLAWAADHLAKPVQTEVNAFLAEAGHE